MLGFASCNSTRRASRRIQRIINEHPELLAIDTVYVDTIIPVIVPGDTAIFSLDDLICPDTCSVHQYDSLPAITRKTEHGTFTIQRLPSREIKISFDPDTILIRYRADYTIPKMTFETRDRSRIQLLIIVVMFLMAILCFRMASRN